MAKVWIPEGKKRITLTLTIANVDRFHALCRRLGMPRNTMSNAVDDIINSVSDTFQMALDKGSMEISDLFKLMGKQMELLEEDKRDVQSKRNIKYNAK
jgi:hypothetical protein